MSSSTTGSTSIIITMIPGTNTTTIVATRCIFTNDTISSFTTYINIYNIIFIKSYYTSWISTITFIFFYGSIYSTPTTLSSPSFKFICSSTRYNVFFLFTCINQYNNLLKQNTDEYENDKNKIRELLSENKSDFKILSKKHSFGAKMIISKPRLYEKIFNKSTVV